MLILGLSTIKSKLAEVVVTPSIQNNRSLFGLVLLGSLRHHTSEVGPTADFLDLDMLECFNQAWRPDALLLARSIHLPLAESTLKLLAVLCRLRLHLPMAHVDT